jgi:hypothetical protein
MAAFQLSDETEKRMSLLFPPSQQQFVRTILFEECGNSERLHFAALKLSEGRLDRLEHAIALAKVDWRDLLMAAGFEEVDAHTSWLPEQTQR